jgi:mono/diheme cytochrome c family protein
MKSAVVGSVAVVFSLTFAWVTLGAAPQAPSKAQTPAKAQAPLAPAGVEPSTPTDPVARGEYITTKLAMCVQCHSGRDDAGNILEAEKFHGGALPVLSPFPAKTFALRAPNIAGLVGFTDEQIISLLTTGKMEGRDAPRPPMPPFRMSLQDAQAVVAYLRTR